MTKKTRIETKSMGRIRKTAEAVKRFLTRGRKRAEPPVAATPAPARPKRKPAQQRAARPAQPRTDIPLDVLDRAYTPPATSSKASFRSDGLDHHRDQEFAFGTNDDGWNDEDRYTNKSGDPRIGTHRRTYEPEEARRPAEEESQMEPDNPQPHPPGNTTGGPAGFGVTSASDSGATGVCAHCGQSLNRSGLEEVLRRLGMTDEMIDNLKTQFQNVDIDEYLNTARDYLKDGSTKAQTYAKEHPGKVTAGFAALALGAGLIYAATRER